MTSARNTLWKRMGSRLSRHLTFRTVEVRVSRHARAVSLPMSVEWREVDATRVGDASGMDGEERIEEFREFLARGDRGWYGYRDGRVVHRAWARRGPATMPLWHSWGSLSIGESEACIHYCETAPSARGLGIYPAALSRIAAELRDSGAPTIWISTTADNHASRRGIEKAGFEERKSVTLSIRFGVASVHERALAVEASRG